MAKEREENVSIHSSGGYYRPAVSRHCARAVGEENHKSGMSLSQRKRQALCEDLSAVRSLAIPPSCKKTKESLRIVYTFADFLSVQIIRSCEPQAIIIHVTIISNCPCRETRI